MMMYQVTSTPAKVAEQLIARANGVQGPLSNDAQAVYEFVDRNRAIVGTAWEEGWPEGEVDASYEIIISGDTPVPYEVGRILLVEGVY